jgi:hypothetical protein
VGPRAGLECKNDTYWNPILWPPRSPDRAPLDLSLWCHLKCTVYAKERNMRGELCNATEMNGTMCNMLNVLQQKTNSWRNEAPLGISCNGEAFQYIL